MKYKRFCASPVFAFVPFLYGSREEVRFSLRYSCLQFACCILLAYLMGDEQVCTELSSNLHFVS